MLEGGHIAELRHDFRHHYHCRYEDVSVEEALDLIDMLPDGSRYVAATDFLRSWSEERHRDASLLDAVNVLVWSFALKHDVVPEPVTVVRPRDMVERARKSKRSSEVRDVLENGSWEEI